MLPDVMHCFLPVLCSIFFIVKIACILWEVLTWCLLVHVVNLCALDVEMLFSGTWQQLLFDQMPWPTKLRGLR